LCAVCTADYTKAGAECINCSDSSGYSSILLSAAVVLIVVVGVCIASSCSDTAEDHAEDAADQLAQGQSGRWWQGLMVRGSREWHALKTIQNPTQISEEESAPKLCCCLAQVMSKILIGLGQMLSELPAALALNFPPGFTAVLNAVKVFLLDVFEVFRVDCITPLSVHAKFVVIMALPPVGVGIVRLLRCAADARAGRGGADAALAATRRAENKAKSNYRMFFVIFLLYPLLSRTAFHMMPTACWALGPGESWHMDDLSIDCASDAHLGFMAFGLACIVIYPIGIPLSFLVLLWRSGRAVKVQPYASETQTTAGVKAASSAYDFLKKDYKPEFYYFECVNLLEKLLVRSHCFGWLVDRGWPPSQDAVMCDVLRSRGCSSSSTGAASSSASSAPASPARSWLCRRGTDRTWSTWTTC
jgi:hypothetical protein